MISSIRSAVYVRYLKRYPQRYPSPAVVQAGSMQGKIADASAFWRCFIKIDLFEFFTSEFYYVTHFEY